MVLTTQMVTSLPFSEAGFSRNGGSRATQPPLIQSRLQSPFGWHANKFQDVGGCQPLWHSVCAAAEGVSESACSKGSKRGAHDMLQRPSSYEIFGRDWTVPSD
eukprot:4677528-Pleurochrysis_carterae.AAC.1